MNFKYLIISFVLCLLVTVTAHSKSSQQECTCPCPQKKIIEPFPSSKQCPESIVINRLVDIYTPVLFPHRSHAEMAGGCQSCHHIPGNYQACVSCHQKVRTSQSKQMTPPDLKAAYHRQCISCHTGGPLGCTECHKPQK